MSDGVTLYAYHDGHKTLHVLEKQADDLGPIDMDDDDYRRGRLADIITDGDLRRHMSRGLLKLKTADIMTRGPKAVPPDMLASAVLEVLNTSKITSVFVVDKGGAITHAEYVSEVTAHPDYDAALAALKTAAG